MTKNKWVAVVGIPINNGKEVFFVSKASERGYAEISESIVDVTRKFGDKDADAILVKMRLFHKDYMNSQTENTMPYDEFLNNFSRIEQAVVDGTPNAFVIVHLFKDGMWQTRTRLMNWKATPRLRYADVRDLLEFTNYEEIPSETTLYVNDILLLKSGIALKVKSLPLKYKTQQYYDSNGTLDAYVIVDKNGVLKQDPVAYTGFQLKSDVKPGKFWVRPYTTAPWVSATVFRMGD